MVMWGVKVVFVKVGLICIGAVKNWLNIGFCVLSVVVVSIE